MRLRLFCHQAYFAVVALSTLSSFAEAQTPQASSSAESPARSPEAEQQLQQAKDLFKQGNELRRAGEYARALELYVRSRSLVASVPNTLNAAFCLHQIGRFDEALELYDELLRDFRAELTDDDRHFITSAMASLRRQLGAIDVSSNVDGVLVIDGRMRGKLPLLNPVPVVQGRHFVRIMKDGYQSFEAAVEVEIGSTKAIDARLSELTFAGRLRIDANQLSGASLIVDGAHVGNIPWEGTLAPGLHIYSVQMGERGSGPARASVVQGQTVTVNPQIGPLGPEIQIITQPTSAEMSIDGVDVGKGRWGGRLLLGNHTLQARESGYRVYLAQLQIQASSPSSVTVALEADRNHPRWALAKPGRFWVETAGGFAFAPSLGTDAESGANRSFATGPLLALRGGYQFPFGLSIEIMVGYLNLSKSSKRSYDETFLDSALNTTSAVHYTLTDKLRLRGPLAGVGVAYHRKVGSIWEAFGRIDVGVVGIRESDTISGSASSPGESLPISAINNASPADSAALFVMPEIGLRARFGPWAFGAAFAFPWILTSGPRFDTGAIRALGPCTKAGAVGCAPYSHAVSNEQAHTSFLTVAPVLSVGYLF